MKILIVEDEMSSQRLLEQLLSSYGECTVAKDGDEGLAAFRLAWQDRQPFDLVCLDIMMPCTDGLQVLKEIRQDEAQRGISGRDGVKIIMVTALSDSKHILQAFRDQCEVYLIKPVDSHKLREKIKLLEIPC